MDYSTLPSDPEHPNGSSPWASSPQHNRTTFSQSHSSDVPPSPLPPAQSPYSGQYDHGRGSLDTGDRPMPQDISADSTSVNGTTLASENNDLEQNDSRHVVQQREVPQQSPYHQNHQESSEGPRPEPQRYRHQKSNVRQMPPPGKLQAKITGLERTGRKDPILRFDVYTDLPKFRTTQFRDVRRTHSEFLKLADHLISSNPEAMVPAVPPPLTAAGAGTEEDESRIKAGMQRWLNYVCGNEVLKRDEEVIFFVESDFGYSPVVRRKQPATGVRRKVLKQFAPPPDDTPELYETRPIVKLFYLGTMDAGQKVDKVVKSRKALGLAEADLGVKMGSMQVQEIHAGLGNAYRKLGKIIQTTGDYHAAQGTAEATTLGDPLQYHSTDAFIVKETLTNRQILMRELLQAQQTTRSRLSATDRLKASSSVRRDKVDEAIAALDEARSNESYLSGKCQRVTANLVQERRRWFARTATDLRQSLREYVIREIEAERRTLATLESVRPDIRAIDATGGLSRLGREAHPATRRATLASSQGPKGDAWSGVPRRPDGLNRSISGSFVTSVPEEQEEGEGKASARKRAGSGAGSLQGVQEEDEDRVDARNAASRLATTTF
ncbi:vacuolar protein sorting-associated protein 17 [Viridothelium virens]|uniref:Vacuolar protein sorting-associated protein 17 n=1 Tax=Viridothelium virens TaxID=1048519 RepID=A0A6A6GTM2_VIRVR|nr:vacuolar protein sorting-associated protein 17 [Viridothelium virens]